MKKLFRIGETVVSVRDAEMSNRAIVTGYQDDGKVLVRFGDDAIPRALPIVSLERPADRPKSELRPIGRGKIWEESANLGDYLRRMGEAETGISTKEKHHESAR